MPAKPKALQAERMGTEAGFARVLQLFELFSRDRALITVEDAIANGGYTRSTAYRHLRQLCDAGFLAASHGGMYSLGPRIVELERLLKLTDPLYVVGSKVLSTMRREGSVLQLCNLYGNRVLCVHHEGPEALRSQGRMIQIRRSRGVPYPLFQGAASLALLANLSPHRIQQIYLRHTQEVAKAGLGGTWDAYRANLAGIRRKGYAVSEGQVMPGLAGIAVPIRLVDEKRVIGSLVKIFVANALSTEAEQMGASELIPAAEEIAERVDHAQ